MEQRLLGRSGFKVPVLSLGTGTFGGKGEFFGAWGASDVREATRLVDLALEAGANMFDSANIYSSGAAEEILGAALKGRRDRAIISTKGTFRLGEGPNDVGSSRFALIRAVEGSLRRLGTDHVDLYQLHGFDALTPVEEVLQALDDLVRAGKIRYLGVSNFSGWHLMKSLAVSRLQSKLVVDQGPPVEEERLYRVVEALELEARELGKTVPQVAINWLLQRPTVANVIIGARDEAQLRDNLGAAGWALSPAAMARLDAASAVTKAYPYWHQADFGERNPPPV